MTDLLWIAYFVALAAVCVTPFVMAVHDLRHGRPLFPPRYVRGRGPTPTRVGRKP